MIRFVSSTRTSKYIMEMLADKIATFEDCHPEVHLGGWIEPYNNCRETGFVMSIRDGEYKTYMNIWAFEHRNSDQPSIGYDLKQSTFNGEYTDEAWRNTKSFNTIDEAVEYAFNLILKIFNIEI